jgi:hypothetical protein
MVAECCTERSWLAGMQPHLVHYVPQAVPFFSWVAWPPFFDHPFYSILPIIALPAFIFYDALAGFNGAPAASHDPPPPLPRGGVAQRSACNLPILSRYSPDTLPILSPPSTPALPARRPVELRNGSAQDARDLPAAERRPLLSGLLRGDAQRCAHGHGATQPLAIPPPRPPRPTPSPPPHPTLPHPPTHTHTHPTPLPPPRPTDHRAHPPPSLPHLTLTSPHPHLTLTLTPTLPITPTPPLPPQAIALTAAIKGATLANYVEMVGFVYGGKEGHTVTGIRCVATPCTPHRLRGRARVRACVRCVASR